MKIVMFQYNRDASAIIQNCILATANKSNSKQLVANRFLASGYADRLLWEEAASLRPKKLQKYIIRGNWQ